MAIQTKTGNINKEDYTVSCIACGAKNGLTQVAFRHNNDSIIGFFYACNNCIEELVGKRLNMEWED